MVLYDKVNIAYCSKRRKLYSVLNPVHLSRDEPREYHLLQYSILLYISLICTQSESKKMNLYLSYLSFNRHWEEVDILSCLYPLLLFPC